MSEEAAGGRRWSGWCPLQKQTEEKIPQPQQKLQSRSEAWVYLWLFVVSFQVEEQLQHEIWRFCFIFVAKYLKCEQCGNPKVSSPLTKTWKMCSCLVFHMIYRQLSYCCYRFFKFSFISRSDNYKVNLSFEFVSFFLFLLFYREINVCSTCVEAAVRRRLLKRWQTVQVSTQSTKQPYTWRMGCFCLSGTVFL